MSYYEFETEVFWWRVELRGSEIVLTRTDIDGESLTLEMEIEAVLPMVRGLLEEYERGAVNDRPHRTKNHLRHL